MKTSCVLVLVLCCSLFVSCRKSEKKLLPRCIYDLPIFAETSLRAAENSQSFLQFKRDPFFNLLWENHSFEEGKFWLQKIDVEYPFLKESFERFRQIDRIGSPKIYNFGAVGDFSPSTLRLIALSGELRAKLEGFKPLHIVQIGAGCGSWCKILNDIFSLKSYTLIDLPEQLELAKKCLENLGVGNVKFFTPDELPRELAFDLVISDRSFSEFNRSYQELFFDQILARSTCGYILGHEFPRHYGVMTMNVDEIGIRLDRLGSLTQRELHEASKDKESYFIFWRK